MKRSMAVMLVMVACGAPVREDDDRRPADAGPARNELLCDDYVEAVVALWEFATDPACTRPVDAGYEWSVRRSCDGAFDECRPDELDKIAIVVECLHEIMACESPQVSAIALNGRARDCHAMGPRIDIGDRLTRDCVFLDSPNFIHEIPRTHDAACGVLGDGIESLDLAGASNSGAVMSSGEEALTAEEWQGIKEDLAGFSADWCRVSEHACSADDLRTIYSASYCLQDVADLAIFQDAGAEGSWKYFVSECHGRISATETGLLSPCCREALNIGKHDTWSPECEPPPAP